MTINPEERYRRYTTAADAATNVDQIEADAVWRGPTPLASALADDTLAEDDQTERYDTAAPGAPTWLADDSALETALSDIRSEIRRRRQLLGQTYPFDLANDTLTHQPGRSRSMTYEFCLAFCVTEHDLRRSPANAAVIAFEHLVADALVGYLGTGSKSFRFGWPPRGGGRQAASLHDTISTLARQTQGEWEFPDPAHLLHPPTDRAGDGGIDVVAWKPFGVTDTRPSLPMILGQCACGRTDGLDPQKWRTLDPDQFQRLRRGSISSAGWVKCLAIPHHLPHPSRWREASIAGGLVLDRVRLTWLAETTIDDLGALRTRLQPHVTALRSRPRPSKTSGPRRRPPSPAAGGRRSRSGGSG